jgi:hypothetical protein
LRAAPLYCGGATKAAISSAITEPRIHLRRLPLGQVAATRRQAVALFGKLGQAPRHRRGFGGAAAAVVGGFNRCAWRWW